MKLALIDNYDSFTHNVCDLIYRVSGDYPTVLHNDEISYSEFSGLDIDGVVISPGPGHPARTQDFGVCSEILQYSEKPVLGICLGHQGIGMAFGGKVNLAPQPVHGRVSMISHDGKGLFEGIPQRVRMVRYHSLMVDPELPNTLFSTAWTDDGLIMGLQHRDRSIFGVQFHPESICSEFGDTLIANFLKVLNH
jgi:anthranilate synthase/aminodeoxychorismate synthase-like glutamine amidotransferase